MRLVVQDTDLLSCFEPLREATEVALLLSGPRPPRLLSEVATSGAWTVPIAGYREALADDEVELSRRLPEAGRPIRIRSAGAQLETAFSR